MVKILVFLICWLLAITSYIICFLPSVFLVLLIGIFGTPSQPSEIPWVGGTPASHYRNWRKSFRYIYIKTRDHIKKELS